jgi:hypothetical protein
LIIWKKEGMKESNVVASEYPDLEPFDSLSDTGKYVERTYGGFILD